MLQPKVHCKCIKVENGLAMQIVLMLATVKTPSITLILYYSLVDYATTQVAFTKKLSKIDKLNSDTERQYYANELSVVIGTTNRLNRTSTTERLLVSHIKIHEKFSPDALYWDIALMILYRKIKLNGWSAAIISLSVTPVDINTVCTVLGWGRIYENGPNANQIVYVDVAVLDSSTCMRIMPHIGEEQSCAADIDDLSKDACQGDVGGPLICDGIFHYSAMYVIIN
uniref:Peptidase S1 domain-containing protein n=1 Tax=Glossina austeni TaxID=7395 RepID=A0A1A9UZQ4_GLOAU